jgi:hypothetical protein
MIAEEKSLREMKENVVRLREDCQALRNRADWLESLLRSHGMNSLKFYE